MYSFVANFISNAISVSLISNRVYCSKDNCARTTDIVLEANTAEHIPVTLKPKQPEEMKNI